MRIIKNGYNILVVATTYKPHMRIQSSNLDKTSLCLSVCLCICKFQTIPHCNSKLCLILVRRKSFEHFELTQKKNSSFEALRRLTPIQLSLICRLNFYKTKPKKKNLTRHQHRESRVNNNSR